MRLIKSRRIGWAGCMDGMREKGHAYRILVGNLKERDILKT
jgi:predicted choloylglycine hydrolase